MQFRILFIIIIALLHPALNSADKKDKYVFYNVKKVVDGDTFWIDDGSQTGLR